MKPVLFLSALMLFTSRGLAQFANITFNYADLSHLRSDLEKGVVGPVGELLQGWQVSLRPPGGEWSVYTGDAGYKEVLGGFGPVSLNYGLHADFRDFHVSFHGYPVEGSPDDSLLADIRLSISGTVPVGAESFRWVEGNGLRVSITDGTVGVVVNGSVGQMDVAKYAGRETVISFTSIGGLHFHTLDITGFTLVPEPTSGELALFASLVVAGAAALKASCWKGVSRGSR